ncbi:MAG: seg [Parcubacteria group bacterium]|nr:seg [Parcubacteria group bacterium]
MEYQVPQFIEVEDKIFGPFTLKQFIYLAGGGGLTAIIILYVRPLVLTFVLIAPVLALTGALAFYRMNNKSFIELLEAGFNYYTKGRLYLWKKEEAVEMPVAAAPVVETRQKLGLSRGRLHDLAWSLDIKDQKAGEESQP